MINIQTNYKKLEYSDDKNTQCATEANLSAYTLRRKRTAQHNNINKITHDNSSMKNCMHALHADIYYDKKSYMHPSQ